MMLDTYMCKDEAPLVHVPTQYSSRPCSVNAHARAKGGGEEAPKGKYLSLAHELSPNHRYCTRTISMTEYGLVHKTSMWANMRMKVEVTRSLKYSRWTSVQTGRVRTHPTHPPLPTGLA